MNPEIRTRHAKTADLMLRRAESRPGYSLGSRVNAWRVAYVQYNAHPRQLWIVGADDLPYETFEQREVALAHLIDVIAGEI